MNKKLIVLWICVGLIFIASIVVVVVRANKPAGQMVEIIQDGATLYTLDLSREKNQTIRIDSPDGGYNIITIQDGTIFMSEANCPDKTCIHTGVLRSENVPIVCLPHKVIIHFVDGEGIA